MANKERFQAAYLAALTRAVEENPEKYCYGVDRVPATADAMCAAIEARSFNHGGRGLQLVCRALGIPHTQKAILAFWHGDTQ